MSFQKLHGGFSLPNDYISLDKMPAKLFLDRLKQWGVEFDQDFINHFTKQYKEAKEKEINQELQKLSTNSNSYQELLQLETDIMEFQLREFIERIQEYKKNSSQLFQEFIERAQEYKIYFE